MASIVRMYRVNIAYACARSPDAVDQIFKQPKEPPSWGWIGTVARAAWRWWQRIRTARRAAWRGWRQGGIRGAVLEVVDAFPEGKEFATFASNVGERRHLLCEFDLLD